MHPFALAQHDPIKFVHQCIDLYNHLNFAMISSRVVPGGKQEIALAALPTHELFIATLNNCSEKKIVLASEMEWSHSSNITVSFSHSEPENLGMPGILLRKVVPDAPWQSLATCIALISTTNTGYGLSLKLIKPSVQYHGFDSSSMSHVFKNLR